MELKTRGAVSATQSDYNRIYNKEIVADGVAGRVTKPALNQILKDAGVKGTKHFKINEFTCRGSGTLPKGSMDSNLILKLEELRYLVGGASKSQHLYGKAADIVVRGVSANKVYVAADKVFNGVGKYPTFTHVDTQDNKARF